MKTILLNMFFFQCSFASLLHCFEETPGTIKFIQVMVISGHMRVLVPYLGFLLSEFLVIAVYVGKGNNRNLFVTLLFHYLLIKRFLIHKFIHIVQLVFGEAILFSTKKNIYSHTMLSRTADHTETSMDFSIVAFILVSLSFFQVICFIFKKYRVYTYVIMKYCF